MQFALLEQAKVEKQWSETGGEKMTISTEKNGQYEITVGDWVTFLASEKYAVTSNVLSTFALLVAVVAILVAIPETNAWFWVQWLRLVVYVGIIAYTGWWYFKRLRPVRKRVKGAGEVLKRIMLGELKDSDSIRNEWIALTETQKAKSQRKHGTNQLIQDPKKLNIKNSKNKS
ncbi:MAG: hypothetical protein ABR914_01820 [Dehalococcoidales bacterium]